MGILDNLRRKSRKEESGANRKIPSRDAELLLERGIRAYFEGRTDDAIRDLEAAIQINPKSYAALGTVGNAYARMGAHEKAIKAFQQCILIADRSESHANIGNSHMALGDFASAVSEFEKALKLNPNDNVAQNNLPIAREAMKGNTRVIDLGKLGK
jgi:tetratricopeptide (TPR) repeat protein